MVLAPAEWECVQDAIVLGQAPVLAVGPTSATLVLTAGEG
jgi:hypothetical protein